MGACRFYRHFYKSTQLVIFFLFLSVSGYSSHLYYIAIDLSKPKAKGFLNKVHDHMKSSILPKLKKNDHIVLVTFSDKTKLIFKKKIRNITTTREKALKAIKSQKEKGSNTSFFRMLYRAVRRVHKHYTEKTNANTLIVYSKSLNTHRNNKKYEKKINLFIRSYKLNESTKLSPIREIYLYMLPKVTQSINLKYYSRDILLTKLNRIAKTQILPFPLKHNTKVIVTQKLKPSLPSQATPKTFGSSSSFFSNHIITIILSLMGLLLIGGIGGYFYFLKKRKPKYFHGFIEYYDEETTKPQKKVLNLTRLRKRQFIIGGQKEHDIFLRGTYYVEPIVVGHTAGNRKEIRLPNGGQEEFSFIKQSKRGFLTSGDVFRVGSYVLQYSIR